MIRAHHFRIGFFLLALALTGTPLRAENSLPVWKDGSAPRSYEQLWAGYDPCREPLDVEVLKEWETGIPWAASSR